MQRGSTRYAPIINPITNDRIIVGIWRSATATPPNAIIAGFDRHGRVFYSITNQDLARNSVTASIATATTLREIRLRNPYWNINPAQLYLVVD
jgi:hypothetical protein